MSAEGLMRAGGARAAVLSPRVRCLTLDAAVWQYQQGMISESEWMAYAHAWQTGAPRFGLRACECVTCRRDYPSEQGYSAVGTGVATDWDAWEASKTDDHRARTAAMVAMYGGDDEG